jgi:uncharacterized protein (TIGR00645 family)
MIPRLLERILFASRWLLAPLYLGLGLSLLLFIVEFCREFVHLVRDLIAGNGNPLALWELRLLDLTLVASLVVMVMISGFENLVSKIRLGENQDQLAWLTNIGTGSLKVKIMSVVAVISAIYLLELFFDIDQVPADKLLWLVILQLTFVVSALLLALLDAIAGRDRH